MMAKLSIVAARIGSLIFITHAVGGNVEYYQASN
jgi:hypothetical protein